LRFKDLPKEVVEDVKMKFMNLLGVALAASRLEFSEIVAKSIAEIGGKPEHTVIGFGYELSALNAALINGTLAHSLDLDEAVGKKGEDVDGKQLITTAVAGYEVITRIGAAAYNPEFRNTAFHYKRSTWNLYLRSLWFCGGSWKIHGVKC